MSILDRLPRENPEEYRVIHSINELAHGCYIDMGFNFINELTPEEWFAAFKEHYEKETGCTLGDPGYKEVRSLDGRTMDIPPENPRIRFTKDSDHSALKFRVGEQDKEARCIIYSFLERLMEPLEEKGSC